ncbi:MAG TPA: hypothetical protein VML55_09235 [Planctomycetaceae bacterium]|nr:hypothetical protein [Planctomycetaceae bacterium]
MALVLQGATPFAAGADDPQPRTQAEPPGQEASEDERIDFERARQLLRKENRGEKLTDEDRAYLDRARAARARMRGQNPPAGNRPPGNRPPALQASGEKGTVGLKPLAEMSADDRYKGQDGGLYGGGRNEPPEEHLARALAAAKQIEPLDREGRPSAEGRIVLISVGMSNTTQEFSAFVQLASGDPERSRQVVIVDGAQGGMDARAWAQPEQINRAGRQEPWTVLDRRLAQAGVTPEQVQVVWLKQARINPGGIGEFPRHAEELAGHIQTILHRLDEEFPNLRLAYLSSRIYAGYARGALNPEPYAYESAFAVRQLIQEQIAGEPSLNADSSKGEVKSPVLLWGPYLWGDGEQPRAADGLVWRRDDLAGDGTHPSQSGRRKVGELLLEFFKSDPTARTWFLRNE